MAFRAIQLVFLRARLAATIVLLALSISARAADGDLDIGYGLGQPAATTVLTELNWTSFAKAVEATASGHAWLTLNSESTVAIVTKMSVTRLLPSGVPDNSFNAGGPVPSKLDLLPRGPAGNAVVSSVVGLVLQGESAPVAGYIAFQGSGVGESGTAAFALNQFSDVTSRLPNDSGVSSYVGVAKITNLGTLDASYGSGGYVWVATGAITARGIALDSAGNLLVLTNANDLNSFTITRIAPNGVVDNSWGASGTVTVTAPGVFMHALALDNQGRIMIAGMRSNPISPQNWDGAIYRLLANGAMDVSFGNSGVASLAFDLGGDNVDSLNDIEIDYRGDLFVVGSSRTGLAATPTSCTVGRVDANGAVLVLNSIVAGTQRDCVGVGVQRGNGGRVYAAARFLASTQATPQGRLFAVRASDLQPDQSFGNSGTASTPAFNVAFDATDLALDPSNRPIIVGGVLHSGESAYATRYVKSDALVSDSFE